MVKLLLLAAVVMTTFIGSTSAQTYSCIEQITEATCNIDPKECQWGQTTQKCVPLPCADRDTEAYCDRPECVFNAKTNVCSDVDPRSPGICYGVWTDSYCTAGLGCEWKPATFRCDQKSCEDRGNYSECSIRDECNWRYDGKGECMTATLVHDSECSGLVTQRTCEEQMSGGKLNCQWSSWLGRCMRAPCADRSESNCSTSPQCAWDSDNSVCNALGCDKEGISKDYCLNQVNCSWQSDAEAAPKAAVATGNTSFCLYTVHASTNGGYFFGTTELCNFAVYCPAGHNVSILSGAYSTMEIQVRRAETGVIIGEYQFGAPKEQILEAQNVTVNFTSTTYSSLTWACTEVGICASMVPEPEPTPIPTKPSPGSTPVPETPVPKTPVPETPAPPVVSYCGQYDSSTCNAAPPTGGCTFIGLYCVSNYCSQYGTDEKGCTQSNCEYNGTAPSCADLNQCPRINTQAVCDTVSSCVWDSSLSSCLIRGVDCASFASNQSGCTENGCSYNTLASPACFETPSGTSVCTQQSSSGNCVARGCSWVFSQCFPPGSAAACALFKNLTSCFETTSSNCVWQSSTSSCIGLSTISSQPAGPLAIRTIPDTPMPGSTFTINVYGNGLTASDKVYLVPTIDDNPEGSCNTTAPGSVEVSSITPADFNAQAAMSASSGLYHVCYVTPTAASFFTNFVLTVVRLPPQVSTIALDPNPPYSGTVFVFDITGEYFTQSDRFTFVPNGTDCPPYNESVYSPLSNVNSNGRSGRGQYTVGTGSFMLCYTNTIDDPAGFATITSQSIAPWVNPTLLEPVGNEIIVAVENATQETMINFNSKRCSAMRSDTLPKAYVAGPYIHPSNYEVSYNDGVRAYPGNDRCVTLVQPAYEHATGSMLDFTPTAIRLDIVRLSIDDGDEMRLFVPLNATVMPTCTNYTTPAACRSQFCTWAGGACDVLVGQLESCPREGEIPGWKLMRSLDFKRFQLGTGSLQTDHQGFIVATCTSTQIPAGTGWSLRYEAEAALCRNDCKDSSGTSHGTCSNTDGLGWRCVCSSQWSGEDCTHRRVCSGSGNSAPVFGGPSGTYVLESQPAAKDCGFLVQTDPTGSSLQRMAKYGVGIEFLSVYLSANCSLSRITVREDSSQGAIVATICASDIVAGQKLRYLVNTTGTVYVHAQVSTADRFTLNYQAVSFVCPGPQGPSGIPLPQDECTGQGYCTAADFQQPDVMTQFAYECICTAPFAQTAPYQSCESCRFGYREDSYPTCTSLTNCSGSPTGCLNGGTCSATDGRCRCAGQFYGLNCEFASSNETIQVSDNLAARWTMDGFAANERALGGSDQTFFPCQMVGSNFPCVTVERNRGRQQNGGKQVTPREGWTGNNSTSSRRQFVAQEESNSAPGDTSILFNKIVTDGKYRDVVRVDGVIGTALDVRSEFTLSCWLKVDTSTTGFLAAKVDNVFYPDGASPILDRGLNDAKDRYLVDAAVQLGVDPLALYWGIYLDGPNRRVSVIQTRGSQRDGDREEWWVVRHFRLETDAMNAALFDGSWRYFVYKFHYKNSRYEGQVYVDAKSIASDPQYTQCFPWPPEYVYSSPPNHTLIGVEAATPGGSFLIGYKMEGSLDELRVYTVHPLDRKDVVEVGGDTFNSELDVQESVLIAMGVLSLIILTVCVSYCAVRLRRENREANEREAATAAAEANPVDSSSADVADENGVTKDDACAVEPDPKEAGLERASKDGSFAAFVVSDAEKAVVQRNSRRSSAAATTVIHVQASTCLVSPVAVGPPSVTPGDEFPVADNESGVYVEEDMTVASVGSVVEETLHTVTSGLDRAHKDVKQANHDERVAAAGAVADAGTVAMQAVGTAYDTGDGGGAGAPVGTGEVRGEVRVRLSNVNPATVLRGVSGLLKVSQDILLRVTIVRDCWQVFALFYHGFEWPEEFVEWWGKVTQVIAIDFAIAYDVPFMATYYIIIGISFALMAGVLLAFVLDKSRSRDDIIAEQADILLKKQEDPEYRPPFKAKDLFTFACVFGVSGIYLPVTRNAVVVVFCHPSVQCVFDCYNEPAHNTAVAWGLSSAVLVSFGAPLLFGTIIYKKKKEFERFVEGSDEDPAESWKMFVRTDTSPYRALYSGFELKWVYFQLVIMLVKGIMCLTTLGLQQNSTSQLLVILCVQILLTMAVFYSAPFLLDLCDYIMEVSQAFVIVALSIACFYRANPAWGGYGETLTTIAAMSFVSQLGMIFWKATG